MDSCETPRRYSGWDASYSNCLCLLLSLTGLTLLVLLVTILIPGKNQNVGPIHQVPEDFDPILYEKLLAEYKARTSIKPSTTTFVYSPSYKTSTTAKPTKEFQPIKKTRRKPIKTFLPVTSAKFETTIRPENDVTEKTTTSTEDFTNSAEVSTISISYLPEKSAQSKGYKSTTEVSETTQQLISSFSDLENLLSSSVLNEQNSTTTKSFKNEKLQNLQQQINEDFEIEQEQTNSEVQQIYPFLKISTKNYIQKEFDTTPLINYKSTYPAGSTKYTKVIERTTPISDQQQVEIESEQVFAGEKFQQYPQEEYKEFNPVQYFMGGRTENRLPSSQIYHYTTQTTKLDKNENTATSPIYPKNTVIVERSQNIINDKYKSTSNVPPDDEEPSKIEPIDQDISQSAQSVLNGGNNILEQRTIVKEKIIKLSCPEPPPVCITKTCKRSASEMIALIDHSADPCDDFYSYACNGLNINRMEDRNSENVLFKKLKDFTIDHPLAEKFKQLYDSCMDFSEEENYVYLRNIMEDLFNDTKYEDLTKIGALTELISNILALSPTGSNFRLLPIFDLTVDLDISGSFVPTLTIPTEKSLQVVMNVFDIYEEQCMRQCVESLGNQKTVQEIYQVYIECSQNIAPYILNLNTTLYALGVLDYLPKLNRSQKIIDIEQDVQFDVYEVLGTVTQRSRLEKLQSVEANPVYMDLDQLQATYPQVNWTTLLSNLFKSRLPQVKTVKLLFKENLDMIFEFFQNTKFVDIKNRIMAMILHDLYMDIKTVGHKCMSEDFCMKLSSKLMEDVTAKILVDKITKKDLSLLDEYIGDLVVRIKDKFRQFLDSSKWLRSDQKQILLEKFEKIKIISNVLNLFFNDGVLTYRNANLKLGKNFAENLINIRKNKRALTYEKIANNPGSVWIYTYNPMATEIFTIPNSHQIVIPIGLISKFAVKKRSYLREYEIQATLGFAISKAILSFFTPIELYSILPDLKENDEFKNFVEVELADPPLTHFENIFDMMVTKEDIKLTMDERFSDDSGFTLAYETFLNMSNIRSDPLIWLNLTSFQLFYLSFAQNFCEHSRPNAQFAVEISESVRLPSYFRINSAIMNSVPFAEHFGCRVGSSMNPQFKVKSFPHIDQVQDEFNKK